MALADSKKPEMKFTLNEIRARGNTEGMLLEQTILMQDSNRGDVSSTKDLLKTDEKLEKGEREISQGPSNDKK